MSFDNRTFYLYGYNFALNSAVTVQSITLPANPRVMVLAMTLTPSGASSPSGTSTVGETVNLVSAVNGNQASQPVTVSSTDGSTFAQSLSDRSTPQNSPDESQVVNLANVIMDNRTFPLHGRGFASVRAETINSITWPARIDVQA
jgi:hypothetical protein